MRAATRHAAKHGAALRWPGRWRPAPARPPACPAGAAPTRAPPTAPPPGPPNRRRHADYVFCNESEAVALSEALKWGLGEKDVPAIAAKIAALPSKRPVPRTAIVTQVGASPFPFTVIIIYTVIVMAIVRVFIRVLVHCMHALLVCVCAFARVFACVTCPRAPPAHLTPRVPLPLPPPRRHPLPLLRPSPQSPIIPLPPRAKPARRAHAPQTPGGGAQGAEPTVVAVAGAEASESFPVVGNPHTLSKADIVDTNGRRAAGGGGGCAACC